MKLRIILFLLVSIVFLQQCKKDNDVTPETTVEEELDTVSLEPDVAEGLTKYTYTIPFGFPSNPIVPSDNQATIQGIALGKKLFFDPILSGDSSQSCGSCHAQSFGFSDNEKIFSEGITGAFGDRNAPTIINPLWGPSFFWDGRAATLEDQALGPVENPIEMHLPWDIAVERLNANASYASDFLLVYGVSSIKKEDVAKAIAQFERTLISANSKFDKYLLGEVTFTDSEKRGEDLFFSEKTECFHCHGTKLFTDNLFHNTGLDAFPEDRGLGKITNEPIDDGKFKSPTLRNIEFSAPYMHDGRFATLEEVVEFYASEVQTSSATLDPLMKNIGPLTTQEKADLVAFMKTLTDEEFLNNPAFKIN